MVSPFPLAVHGGLPTPYISWLKERGVNSFPPLIFIGSNFCVGTVFHFALSIANILPKTPQTQTIPTNAKGTLHKRKWYPPQMQKVPRPCPQATVFCSSYPPFCTVDQKQHHVPYSLAILINAIFLLIYGIASTLWAFQYVFSCT